MCSTGTFLHPTPIWTLSRATCRKDYYEFFVALIEQAFQLREIYLALIGFSISDEERFKLTRNIQTIRNKYEETCFGKCITYFFFATFKYCLNQF